MFFCVLLPFYLLLWHPCDLKRVPRWTVVSANPLPDHSYSSKWGPAGLWFLDPHKQKACLLILGAGSVAVDKTKIRIGVGVEKE